jgi:glycosyltransferase involved in cell wall biosynthesis
MNKLKIVWICHFSNKEVREQLPLASQKLRNSLKNLLGEKKKNSYRDFAPWVTNLTKEFKNFKEVELHIIAPHTGLERKTAEFKMDGIHYHFFKSDESSVLGKLKEKLVRKKDNNYISNRKIVQQLITKIKPDIINLIGTENPYYSITTLDIANIPVYVSVQTVYTNPLRKTHSFVEQERWDLELKIHQKEIYFGCGGRMHRDLILKNNPQATVFKMFFPLEKPSLVKEVPKEFDFVFFASGVTNKKGVEDAIDAFAIVRIQMPKASLNIVGGCSRDYKLKLQKKIESLDLQENISFNGYFDLHADMHQHLKRARFAVLPNKLDIISSTVIEAILLELPLVTNRTSGSPYLNKDRETVLLADIDDVESLAENMLRLLNNLELAERLKRDAKFFVEKEFDNATSAKRLLSNYKAVIDHYHQNITIPNQQLFDMDEFPIY